MIFQNRDNQRRLNRKGECKFAFLRRGYVKSASFILSATVTLSVAVLLVFLQGCSLEDETEDRIVVPLKDPSSLSDSPLTLKFLHLTRKCTTGDMNEAPNVLSMYLSSLPSDDVPDSVKSHYRGLLEDRYLFQRKDLNTEFEKCLQKASVSGLKEYRTFYLTKAPVLSRISQYYYAHNDYENGSYWALRVVNLLGISKGYNILGRVFVKDPKTVKAGAMMLSESAKHDNVSALAFLSDSVLYRNVFDIVSEEEESLNQDNSDNKNTADKNSSEDNGNAQNSEDTKNLSNVTDTNVSDVSKKAENTTEKN